MDSNSVSTFRKSLSNAAFISSSGEVYRLFPDLNADELIDDEPDNTEEFNLAAADTTDNYFLSNDHSSLTNNNFSLPSNNQATDSQFILPSSDADISTFNHQVDRVGFGFEVDGELAGAVSGGQHNDQHNDPHNDQHNDPQFRHSLDYKLRVTESGGVGDDCDLVVSQLLAIEAPTPIIHVPNDLPEPDMPLDERIRRSRCVIGICKNYQQTVQEKIISGQQTTAAENITIPTKPKTPLLNFPQQKIHYPQNIRSQKIPLAMLMENSTSLVPVLDKTPAFLNKEQPNKEQLNKESLNKEPEIIPFQPAPKETNKNKQPTTDSPIIAFPILHNENHDKNKPKQIEQNDATKITDNLNDNNTQICPSEIYNEPKITEQKNEESKIVESKIAEPKIVESKIAEPKIAESKIAESKHAKLTSEELLKEESIISESRSGERIELVSGGVGFGVVGGYGDGFFGVRRELCGYEFPQRVLDLFELARDHVSFIGDQFIRLRDSGKRVISVNGCFSGDGCSVNSVFAAVELALRGVRVLLVDFNEFNPVLSEFLGISDVVSDFAAGDIVTIKNNLDFISIFPQSNKLDQKTTDQSTIKPSILKSKRSVPVSIFIESVLGLRSDYDLILFDSGHLSNVPFGVSLRMWREISADGLFLVVSEKNFPTVNFGTIAKRLSEQQIDLLGIIINA
ncbi:MAG: hypothetical protein LBQ66_09540 [Planctomycetaceae bacterium]|nr:hypothetical protein [Planctomycetaceae bacterium]